MRDSWVCSSVVLQACTSLPASGQAADRIPDLRTTFTVSTVCTQALTTSRTLSSSHKCAHLRTEMNASLRCSLQVVMSEQRCIISHCSRTLRNKRRAGRIPAHQPTTQRRSRCEQKRTCTRSLLAITKMGVCCQTVEWSVPSRRSKASRAMENSDGSHSARCVCTSGRSDVYESIHPLTSITHIARGTESTFDFSEGDDVPGFVWYTQNVFHETDI